MLIEDDDCDIEEGRKADPQEIGHEEIKGRFGQGIEVFHRQEDESQEGYNGDESQKW